VTSADSGAPPFSFPTVDRRRAKDEKTGAAAARPPRALSLLLPSSTSHARSLPSPHPYPFLPNFPLNRYPRQGSKQVGSNALLALVATVAASPRLSPSLLSARRSAASEGRKSKANARPPPPTSHARSPLKRQKHDRREEAGEDPRRAPASLSSGRLPCGLQRRTQERALQVSFR